MEAVAVALAVGIAALYSVAAVRYCVNTLRWLPRHERWVRAKKGLCRTCGYDLTGNVSGICPECGTKVSQEVVADKARSSPPLIVETQPWWVWAVVVTMMILAVILRRLFRA